MTFDVSAPGSAMRESRGAVRINTDTRTGTQCGAHLDGRIGGVRTGYRYGPRLHAWFHLKPLSAGHPRAGDNSCSDAGKRQSLRANRGANTTTNSHEASRQVTMNGTVSVSMAKMSPGASCQSGCHGNRPVQRA